LDHTNSDDEIPLACLWNRVEGSDTNFDQMFEIESTLPIEEPSNEKGEISLLDKIKFEDDSETEESIDSMGYPVSRKHFIIVFFCVSFQDLTIQ
jgi:hypothetical protein